MFRSLRAAAIIVCLSSPFYALATDADYFSCKQTAYDKLIGQYQSALPDQAQSVTEAQGDKISSEASEYERDYDKAQAACAGRYPDRNLTRYNTCVTQRTQGQASNQTQTCEQRYPERDVALYNTCLDGAVNAGAVRFNKFFTRDANLTNKPEAQALIAQYQAEYTQSVAQCANLRDNSPVNSSITSCESASNSATSTCSSSGASGSLGAVDQTTMGTTCSDANAKTNSAISSLSSIQTSCSSAVTSCQAACSSAESQVTSLPGTQRSSFESRVPSAKSKCQTAQSQLDGINQAMTRARSTQTSTAACEGDVTQGLRAADSTADTSNPAVAIPSLGDNSIAPVSPHAETAASNPYSGSSDLGSVGGGGTESSGSLGSFAAAAASFAVPFANAVGALTGNSAAGPLPAGSGTGISGFGTSANQPGAGKTNGGKRVAAIDPKAWRKTGGAGPNAFGAVVRGAGNYRDNGSWIPPKVGEKTDGAQNVNLDRFRPDLKGLRQPTSDDPRSQLLSADQDIWKQINFQYGTQAKKLSP